MAAQPKRSSYSSLVVETYPTRLEMGRAAAEVVAAELRRAVRERGGTRVIFACAPSQDEFLAALVREPDVPWQQITAFHMDEYVGLAAEHPQSFRRYLREHLLDHVSAKEFHPLRGECVDATAECKRYEKLLAEGPIDLICLGIGENGHIAFNDPPVADFDDPARVKVVELDSACRQQQVNDGCFPDFESVPRQALTLTIPVFREARRLSIVVPGPRKAEAVRNALMGPVHESCPASILRRHSNGTLYLDADSAERLGDAR